MRSHHLSMRSRQSGAVLIVSLLFLVILTILAITAMSGTTLEHRMAGNTRDHAIAMQAAEAALRDAHRDVNPNPKLKEQGRNAKDTSYGNSSPGVCGTDPSPTGNQGLCMALPQVEGPTGRYILPPAPDVESVPNVVYGTYTGAEKLKGAVSGKPNTVLPKQPIYIAETLCGIAPPEETLGAGTGVTCGYRRITARGYGLNPNTKVTLQEIYRIAQY